MKLFGVPRSTPARSEGLRGEFRLAAPDIVGAPIDDPGNCRRSAGRGGRAGVLLAGDGEIDLWHRLFHASQHGEQADCVLRQAAHHARLPLKGERTYAIEGSIFVAGAAIKWLRDGLGVIQTARIGRIRRRVRPAQPIYLVPAFVGLGAPHWDPDVAARSLA